jgi:hypothetical protein
MRINSNLIPSTFVYNHRVLYIEGDDEGYTRPSPPLRKLRINNHYRPESIRSITGIEVVWLSTKLLGHLLCILEGGVAHLERSKLVDKDTVPESMDTTSRHRTARST